MRSTTRSRDASNTPSACGRTSTSRRTTERRRPTRARYASPRAPRPRSSPWVPGTGMVIPHRRPSRPSRACRRIARIRTGRWRSRSMAQASSSAPTRTLFLLHGEDPFRIRLRANELVHALLAGEPAGSARLAERAFVPYAGALGLTRIDAREAAPDDILIAGQSQGLFAAPDEKRVVLVEHAETLAKSDVIARFPADAALVLVAPEAIKTTRSRGRRTKAATAEPDAA